MLTSQAVKIYRLLLVKKSATALEIARGLNIFPQAVYREIALLEQVGCVRRLGKYPIRFIANPIDQAVETYLEIERGRFLNNFPLNDKPTSNTAYKQDVNINLSFISDWADLNRKSNEDISCAKQTVDLIVSGLEVPAETILVYKKAIDRRVKIRLLVQSPSKKFHDMYAHWQKMGLVVRHISEIKVRLFIIDNKIVYLVSYEHNNKQAGAGVRLHYPPIASLMANYFVYQWRGEIKDKDY